jgi:hypothetical protein
VSALKKKVGVSRSEAKKVKVKVPEGPVMSEVGVSGVMV